MKIKRYKAHVFSNGCLIKTISADTITELKRQASIICNQINSVCDEMVVIDRPGTLEIEYRFYRINKKSPDDRIIYGVWR